MIKKDYMPFYVLLTCLLLTTLMFGHIVYNAATSVNIDVKPYVKITQRVEIASLIDCGYNVKTHIWVKNYPEPSNSFIEKGFYEYNVKKEIVEITKQNHMTKALILKSKLEQKITVGWCN